MNLLLDFGTILCHLDLPFVEFGTQLIGIGLDVVLEDSRSTSVHPSRQELFPLRFSLSLHMFSHIVSLHDLLHNILLLRGIDRPPNTTLTRGSSGSGAEASKFKFSGILIMVWELASVLRGWERN